MLVTLDQWKDYMTILKNSAVITFFRNDTMRSVYDNWIIRLQNLGADIIVIEESIPDVSSTEIREMLSAGDDVSVFLTDEIFDYIVSNGLYGDL
jgi:nicotinic acid mononucleotide adenylyltransferase